MLVTLALGAMLAAADSDSPSLDGVGLASSVKDFLAAHPGAVAAKTPAGPVWTWTRPQGGTLRVTAGEDGSVAIVEFVAGKTAGGSVDLPAAKRFPIASAHDAYSQLSSYLESDACAQPPPQTHCYAYTLEDGSELLLDFAPDGTGLRQATWGDRELLKTLGLIAPGTSL
jgi:hypothetical protein